MEQKIKVLIADPCADYRRLVTWHINDAPDLELVGDTGSGSEALQIIWETEPDVIVWDIQLAHLDGISMMHHLRKQQVDVSGVLVSSFRSNSLSAEVFALGVYCILLKPFNIETLLEIIRSVSGKAEESAPCDPDLERTVTETLHKVSMPPHLKGYQYLRDAIAQMVMDQTICHAMMERCYSPLARKFNTVPARIERAIRHAIEISWKHSGGGVLRKLFGDTASKQDKTPTNCEWMVAVADYVVGQMEYVE